MLDLYLKVFTLTDSFLVDEIQAGDNYHWFIAWREGEEEREGKREIEGGKERERGGREDVMYDHV